MLKHPVISTHIFVPGLGSMLCRCCKHSIEFITAMGVTCDDAIADNVAHRLTGEVPRKIMEYLGAMINDD